MNQSLRIVCLIACLGVALAACGTPAAPTAPEPEVIPATPVAVATPTGTTGPGPTELPTVVLPPPVATSRGPELEASDPEVARLDAGSLQLVEFFRFT